MLDIKCELNPIQKYCFMLHIFKLINTRKVIFHLFFYSKIVLDYDAFSFLRLCKYKFSINRSMYLIFGNFKGKTK